VNGLLICHVEASEPYSPRGTSCLRRLSSNQSSNEWTSFRLHRNDLNHDDDERWLPSFSSISFAVLMCMGSAHGETHQKHAW
jgi:hypothetical protein